MIIGIDLDGVVFDSERQFRVYAELYDILTIKKNSIKDPQSLLFENRYDWTKSQVQDFLKNFHEKIIRDSSFMPGAKDVLKLLKKDGYKLIVITSRGLIHKKEINITKEMLKKEKMDIFDKYYFSIKNKLEICQKESIDLMIDDSINNCISVAENDIKTIYFRDSQNYNTKEGKYLKVMYNWGEIYRYINDIGKKGEKYET